MHQNNARGGSFFFGQIRSLLRLCIHFYIFEFVLFLSYTLCHFLSVKDWVLLNGVPTYTHRHPPLDLHTYPHPPTSHVTHPRLISLTHSDLPTFAHPCPYLSKLAHTHPYPPLDLHAYPHQPTSHVTHPCPISLTHLDLPTFAHICPNLPAPNHTQP